MAASITSNFSFLSNSAQADSYIGNSATAMHDSALFAGLTHEECRGLASSGMSRAFDADEFLFMQGEPIRHVMLVVWGSVKLSQVNPDGNEVILWINGRSELLGVPSGTNFHSCAAHALDRCRVLRWECGTFQAFMQKHPQIRHNIDNIVSGKLRELEDRLLEMTTEGIGQRVARNLVRLAKSVGQEHADGVLISVSREELAKMSGLSMFTISRLISTWNTQGLVLSRREAVVLCSIDRLISLFDPGRSQKPPA